MNLEKKVEKTENLEEEQYVENTNIKIDTEKFNQILESLVQYLNELKKSTLSALISAHQFELLHNKWILKVPTEIHKQLLEKERDLIVSYMRGKLGIEDIYLQVLVDINLQITVNKPYTSAEKMREMANKNPLLIQLQELFKTRIID